MDVVVDVRSCMSTRKERGASCVEIYTSADTSRIGLCEGDKGVICACLEEDAETSVMVLF